MIIIKTKLTFNFCPTKIKPLELVKIDYIGDNG